MARGINKVIIVGSVGSDPEVRYTQNNAAITTVSIATNEEWTDKNTGNKEKRTEWHRAVFFNRLGEIAGEYLKKGSQVYVEGSLRTRKWQDQQGQDRYTTEIVGSELQMLGGRPDGQQRPQHGSQQPQQRQQPNSRQNANHTQQSPQPQQYAPANYDDFDSDIPF